MDTSTFCGRSTPSAISIDPRIPRIDAAGRRPMEPVVETLRRAHHPMPLGGGQGLIYAANPLTDDMTLWWRSADRRQTRQIVRGSMAHMPKFAPPPTVRRSSALCTRCGSRSCASRPTPPGPRHRRSPMGITAISIRWCLLRAIASCSARRGTATVASGSRASWIGCASVDVWQCRRPPSRLLAGRAAGCIRVRSRRRQRHLAHRRRWRVAAQGESRRC